MLRLIALLLLVAFPALAQPNIVLILADDFSMDLMPRGNGIDGDMPNLARMQAGGMTLRNYLVTQSRCCPSRASLFTGNLPHNTGVLTNNPPDGGLTAYTAHGNEAKSFALTLQAAGYQTGFLGKYLNGYKPGSSPQPPGWNEWASTSNGYQAFGYTLNHNGVLSSPAEHMTDKIAALGVDWIGTGPFFLELAPFSPHAPYIPPARYADAFPGITYPQTPAFAARPDAAAPNWLQIIPPLTATDIADFNADYRKRVQASKAIDDMIGAVRDRIDALGIADNTYVIFTSDNGYHMGEMSLGHGKQTPFDFDVHVPFVIVGPGIAPNSKSATIAMNIDLHPTFLDLAGLSAPDTDGHSIAPAFFGQPVQRRTMAVIEHAQDAYDPNDPDASPPKSGEPPTYTALRGKTWMYVEYVTGEVGYYDMIADPDQLHNIAASLTPARLAELRAAAVANATCAGVVQCAAAQAMP